MEAYKHFGLNAPPFEGRPDPRFFHAAVAHAETLATLQYALHAGKSCTLVLGDSGSGKTLLGRVLLERSAGRATAAWMHGIGQPPGQTAVTLCSFGRPERPAPLGHGGPDESVLADWARTLPRSGHPTLLIVDNADGLRKDNWEDILALVTREIRAPRSLSLVLLGLPSLVDTLAGPGLVRLQRRLFRTCTVARLTAEEVAAYVRHRLTMAGGRNQQVFTPGALDLIHRFTDGNPALINQLCDNAMVDAFGEIGRASGRERVFTVV
jgi:general secretion pathway protein A